MTDATKSIRNCLEEIEKVGRDLEGIMDKSDEYWTWAGFFQDNRDDLVTIKDRSFDIGKKIRSNLTELRTNDSTDEYSQYFDKLEAKESEIMNQGQKIADTIDPATLALNGDDIAEMLHDLIPIIEETAEIIRELLDAMDT